MADLSERQWFYRVGGVAAVVGALLGMVGNLIHPATAGPGEPASTARVVADSGAWIPIHLAIVVGLVLMLGGLAAVCQSIRGGLAGALARLGLAAAIVGTTVGIVLVSLDGFAAKHLADAWLAAPADGREAALSAFKAVDAMNFALLSPFNLVFAGFTFVLYGMAGALSRIYPAWLGWLVVIAGVGGSVSGVIQAWIGEPTAVTTAIGIAAPTVITLWLLVMGLLLIRLDPERVG